MQAARSYKPYSSCILLKTHSKEGIFPKRWKDASRPSDCVSRIYQLQKNFLDYEMLPYFWAVSCTKNLLILLHSPLAHSLWVFAWHMWRAIGGIEVMPPHLCGASMFRSDAKSPGQIRKTNMDLPIFSQRLEKQIGMIQKTHWHM